LTGITGHIAVEGPIGVGKTVLAELLADKLQARLILEGPESNPFLPQFYKDRDKFAFQTQIFFLMSRYAQQEQFAYDDLFSPCAVSDYMFAKDRLFARLNLSDNEFTLYENIAGVLMKNVAVPDLVIYLTASTDTLIQRIKKRNRAYEKGIEKSYLHELCTIYSDYFFSYSDSPLLVVKTDNIDFSRDEDKLNYIVEKASAITEGAQYLSFGGVASGLWGS
jgi:deoxyadenosine/deoxycytidine kinase